ncbi:hypothetical protein [Acaryochloris sp. IP29b_bin.137]|uniref:hypothetical protein n=1 Tax=Acaryochloris sp. IP29b_bin.137 TaxID=2969217 RepID=UPI00261A3A4A|nr:hypothetical protein [Acaryochloris sp. IP29b_bin.137]
MTEGLVWLALLGVFMGLVRAGWLEYRKVEAYRLWAKSFERAKYDIYAVLGQKGQIITWGLPTPDGPTHLKSCDIRDIDTVQVLVDGQPLSVDIQAKNPKQIQLQLFRQGGEQGMQIPFTEVALAVEWAQYLSDLCKP